MMKENQDKNSEELTITHIFDAPHVSSYGRNGRSLSTSCAGGGSKGFTSPVSKIDLRIGGEYLNCMRSPEGQNIWSKGVFREIVAPERLVMTDSFVDEKDNTVPASNYGLSKGFPLEMDSSDVRRK